MENRTMIQKNFIFTPRSEINHFLLEDFLLDNLLLPLLDETHLLEWCSDEADRGHEPSKPEDDLKHTEDTHASEETNQTTFDERNIYKDCHRFNVTTFNGHFRP